MLKYVFGGIWVLVKGFFAVIWALIKLFWPILLILITILLIGAIVSHTSERKEYEKTMKEKEASRMQRIANIPPSKRNCCCYWCKYDAASTKNGYLKESGKHCLEYKDEDGKKIVQTLCCRGKENRMYYSEEDWDKISMKENTECPYFEPRIFLGEYMRMP